MHQAMQLWHKTLKFECKGEQLGSFLVTEVLYEVWQQLQMEVDLYHVEQIACKLQLAGCNFSFWK